MPPMRAQARHQKDSTPSAPSAAAAPVSGSWQADSWQSDSWQSWGTSWWQEPQRTEAASPQAPQPAQARKDMAEKLCEYLLKGQGNYEGKLKLLRGLAATGKPIFDGLVVEAPDLQLAIELANERRQRPAEQQRQDQQQDQEDKQQGRQQGQQHGRQQEEQQGWQQWQQPPQHASRAAEPRPERDATATPAKPTEHNSQTPGPRQQQPAPQVDEVVVQRCVQYLLQAKDVSRAKLTLRSAMSGLPTDAVEAGIDRYDLQRIRDFQ
mmetsp:Transcript_67203/g.185772  ORF Transcript_67203/g.185772 Transcript_67203/m.185772 type:complete len:265 (-) Transcript_67203:72-866(-)